LNAATNVAVKVFFGDASLGLPPLPANFWTGFPNNAVPGTSPWQPIAPHATIPSVSAGRAEIVEFDWPVPATAAQHSCLLAIITADNDSIATTELDVGTLVINNKKCGLKNLTIVDPPPGIGPRTRALKLNIWKPRKGKLFALGADAKGVEFIRGIVLTRQLSKLAQKNKIRKYKLNRQDEDDLLSLIRLYPGLEKQLDVGNAYVPTRGVWFKNVPLNAERPEMLIALINPKAKPGSGTLMQLDEEGRIVGGFTIRVQGPAQTDNGS
jgi:hypothetical protein